MIQIGDTSYPFSDPAVLAVLGGLATLLLILILLITTLRRAGQSAEAVNYVAHQMGRMSQDMIGLAQGQNQLAGNIQTVSDAQANAQVRVIQTMEARLAEVQAQVAERLADNALKSAHSLAEMNERLKETLTGSSEKTTKSLTELQERLATIDRAQTNIEKLSGDVLSLQDILSNKQRRGLFGEIQLTDIVSKALPTDSFTLQATLSNGKRADCLVHLPKPPGPIVIGAKFPFESYEALARADTQELQKIALRDRAMRCANISRTYRNGTSSKAKPPMARSCSCHPKRSMPNCTPACPKSCAPVSMPVSGSCRPRPAWPR